MPAEIKVTKDFPTGNRLTVWANVKCLFCQPEGKGISLPFLNSAREATVHKEQM